MLAACVAGASARAEDAALGFGTSAPGSAVPGVEQVLLLQASAGTALHLRLDHWHLDVEMRVLGPDETVLGAVENMLSATDPLTLTVVVARPGTQRVLVRLRSRRARGGPYQLAVGPESPATAADRTRMEAEQLRADADRVVAKQDGAVVAQALDAYRSSAERWRLLGDSFELAITLGHEGGLLETLGRQREAEPVLEEALTAWRQVGDAGGESNCLDMLGLVVTEMGDPHRGLSLLEQALELRRQAGPLPYAEGSILNDMAVTLGNLGNRQAAIDRYTEALELMRRDGDEEAQAEVLKNRAGDYAGLGDNERALFDFREARAKFRILGNGREEGVTDYVIGITLGDLRRPAEAWSYFESALALLTKSGDERFIAFTLNHIGLLQLEAGRYDEAAGTFDQALAKLQAAGDRRSSANVRMNLARTLLERGRPFEALEPLAAAREELHVVGDRNHEAMALTHLAKAEWALGLLERARQHLVDALLLTEEMRASIAGPTARATYVASERTRYEMLVSVLMALHAQDPTHGWDAEALAASETSRARSLLEILADAHADIQADADPALKVAEDALAVRLDQARQAQQALLSRPHRPDEADQVERSLAEIRAEEERLQTQIRATSPRYASLASPAPLNLAEIRERVLDPSTSLVEYFVGESESFVWVVSENQLVSSRLPGQHELGRAVEAVYRRWSDPAALDDGDRAARALSRLVLTPVASALHGERLLVVADGPLQQIPFAALPTPGSGRPLLEDHTLVSLPSASVLAVLTQPRGEGTRDSLELAIIADPLLSDDGARGRRLPSDSVASLPPGLVRSLEDSGLRGLERLPGTRLEAEAIAVHASPGQVVLAMGADASRATALGPEVSRARIVHFATHALLDVRRPEFSGIVLAEQDAAGRPQDGFLSLADVYRMHLSAELVVLSACRTGLGKAVSGEGLVGLTRGFMYAGAPRVVASLWKVSDRATLALMERFYALMLDQRLAPAEALRAAQRAVRREHRYASPHAWAGFVVQGDWRAISRPDARR